MNTQILANLWDIETSFWALLRRRTISDFVTVRPAAMQAIVACMHVRIPSNVNLQIMQAQLTCTKVYTQTQVHENDLFRLHLCSSTVYILSSMHA